MTSAAEAHLIEFVRLPDLDNNAFARFQSMVLIRDLSRPLRVDVVLLQTIFDLTPRESSLAAALFRSPSLVQAAAEIGVTHETARSQLKSIFAKTGTSSQNQLIGVLSRLGPSTR